MDILISRTQLICLVMPEPEFEPRTVHSKVEMQMIRWLYEEFRKLVGVEPITTVIRSGRLRWYGHVMKKNSEDCVKKCM